MAPTDGDAGIRQPGYEKSSGWYSPHRAIVALGASLIAVAIAGGTLGVVNATRAEHAMTIMSDRYLVLQPPVRGMRAGVADFQVLAEQAFVDSASDSTLLASAELDSNATDSNYLILQRLLALPGNATLAPHLSAQMAAYVAARSDLGAFLAGQKPGLQTAHLAAVEQSADASLDAALARLQSTVSGRLTQTASQAGAAAHAARVDLLWSLAVGTALQLRSRHCSPEGRCRLSEQRRTRMHFSMD